MVLHSFEELKNQLVSQNQPRKRVVVANPSDEQTLQSVGQLCGQGFITPIFIGNKKKIYPLFEKMSFAQTVKDKIEWIDLDDDQQIAQKAVSMIKDGLGDVLMKGHIQTKDLLKAVVNKEYGIKEKAVLSHVSINEVPDYHKLLFLTDGGMVLTPDLAKKEAILENVLSLTSGLGYQISKVAVLDASENLNSKLPASVDAYELKQRYLQGKYPNAIVEGPISFDLAISKEIAIEKEYTSLVAGDADVLLVHDIVSGNLLGKSLVTFGHGQMAGLVLGASVPIVITSRGSSMQEKRNSLLLACSM